MQALNLLCPCVAGCCVFRPLQLAEIAACCMYDSPVRLVLLHECVSCCTLSSCWQPRSARVPLRQLLFQVLGELGQWYCCLLLAALLRTSCHWHTLLGFSFACVCKGPGACLEGVECAAVLLVDVDMHACVTLFWALGQRHLLLQS